jgi:site-specific recombinase XerD
VGAGCLEDLSRRLADPMLVGKLERCDELVRPVFPERARRGESRDALATRPTDPLFVRRDGSALSPQALDRLVRGLAERAGVVLPAGAAAHAFRHHYGVTLALRDVPGNVISQLMGHADPRTTSIYTNPRKFHQTRDYLVTSVSE